MTYTQSNCACSPREGVLQFRSRLPCALVKGMFLHTVYSAIAASLQIYLKVTVKVKVTGCRFQF